MSRADPVTSAVREAVLRRDGGCIAHRLGFSHLCRDQWGNVHGPYDLSRMTLDHVRDAPMMGKRAQSDASHLVVLCHFSHIGSGWATAHRPELRAYLEEPF